MLAKRMQISNASKTWDHLIFNYKYCDQGRNFFFTHPSLAKPRDLLYFM